MNRAFLAVGFLQKAKSQTIFTIFTELKINYYDSYGFKTSR
jgi:hypothetical protein